MKNSKEVLLFSVVLLAINGDVSAVNRVLKYFEHYIIKLAQKTVFDVVLFLVCHTYIQL
ncbi:helix-turn-helix domain-containing protein [Listeria monocytogenes]|nr:helix-turn-helix domain-containing protein [Listeria monocytogenes]EDH3594483.1 helix-turn-helix domain-containing protein [Listeria monocytogenes]EKZ4847841.1 helix-turn-helix domain-containing protein [Listeria monocytogenes]HAO6008548.1 helix-turn-helix domain-containing protein [Listeria monocytogenes]